MSKFDFLIVGQGIAGSILAYELVQQNKKVILFDNNYPSSSSRVAAGLFNPVTGRKMVKTWMADTIFPYLHTYYTKLEQKLNARFFYPLPLFYVFGSVKEANDIAIRLAEDGIDAYKYNIPQNDQPRHVKHPLGYAAFTQTGWCNTRALLSALNAWLRLHAEMEETQFMHEELKKVAGGYQYKHIEAEKVIFCEGTGMLNNPYFSFLPMTPVKGEILTIYAPELKLELIAKQHTWIIPTGNDYYRVGATFDRDNLSDDCTTEGLAFLETRLKKLISTAYTVTDHQAGVRPSVNDRRPLIGEHPQFTGMYVFNGMGAKGVSLVPFLAGHLIAHMLEGAPLHQQISLNRFAAKRSRDLQ